MNKIYIIGMGPGTQDHLLPIAKKTVEWCDCLIGAKRHISMFQNLGKEEVPIDGHFNEVVPYIKRYKDKKRLAVLVSGDPGIYSLLEKISGALKPEEYVVIPGISTVQLAFARIGKGWYGAKIISLHGRKADNLVSEVKGFEKVFIFTDPKFPPDRIAADLLKKGVENRQAIVMENLSYPNEYILDTDLRRLSKIKKRFGLCAMIIERSQSTSRRPEGRGLASFGQSRRPEGRGLASYSQSHRPQAVKGKLYGIGIGPGDPGLVTLKAKEILDRVDTVFVPKASGDGESVARSIVEAVTAMKKSFVELTFPMTKDRGLLRRYWLRSARRIAKELGNKREAAFVTIGDPLIYSTYVYLLNTLRRYFPDVDIETVPGISAFNAAASSAAVPLVKGDERLAVVPVRHDLNGLKEVLEEFDTVVLMKVGSKLKKVIRLLKDMKLIKRSVLVSHVGHKNEKIIDDLASVRGTRTGYLSCVIVKRRGLG